MWPGFWYATMGIGLRLNASDYDDDVIRYLQRNLFCISDTRSNSGNMNKAVETEFAKRKLRTTKTTSSGSGWQLDPYKERGVGKVGKKKK